MYVVEIKRKREIGEDVVEEVAAKVDALRKKKGQSVRAVLGKATCHVTDELQTTSVIPKSLQYVLTFTERFAIITAKYATKKEKFAV